MSADDTFPPSTPPPLSDLEDGKENSPTGARFLDSPSSSLTSTVACPNCGRRFTGNYCPTCGQKADAELTIWDIVGGFFRDLVDANRGLWPTLKGLTIVPGRTLRHYLSGARRQYVNPGRYLLFALLFWGAVSQLMEWTRIDETSAGSDPPVDAVEVAIQVILPSSPEGYSSIALACLFASLLGVLYRQLFASQIRNWASAVAVAVFVSAHGILLSTILNLCWELPQYVMTGTPMNGYWVTHFGTLLGYAGVATYSCFQSHWLDGLKAALAVFWAIVEAFSVWIILVIGYAGILSFINPETYPPIRVRGEEPIPALAALFLMAFLSILASVPLLLHAGVAAYARRR